MAPARSGTEHLSGGIGILGGTFDPIHLGHLRAAEEVREAEGLDEIRFVPAAVPPHKEAEGITPAPHRLRMVELAVAGCAGFRPWGVELARSGPSYSVDTVRALRAEWGRTSGSRSSWDGTLSTKFHTWRDPETILSLCDLVIITRPPWPGYAVDRRSARCRGRFLSV